MKEFKANRWRNRQRKKISEFTSCIRKMETIGMRRSRKSCVARPWEEWRYAVSKFKRAGSMKIAVVKIKMQHCIGDLKNKDSPLEEES